MSNATKIWEDFAVPPVMNHMNHNIVLEGVRRMGLNGAGFCQGPWNVDLRTPPGQECSNGSLLHVCRGHPGIF